MIGALLGALMSAGNELVESLPLITRSSATERKGRIISGLAIAREEDKQRFVEQERMKLILKRAFTLASELRM
jgi:hypothetical protein